MVSNLSAEEPRIDVIDLTLPEEAIVAALRKACEDVGFFYIVNHGIDPVLREKIFAESKKFFDLPTEEKLKVSMNKTGHGYAAYKEETLDPSKNSTGDTKEGYYIRNDIPPDDPRSSKPLHGVNQWPCSELLPEWKDTMTIYWNDMLQLCLKMVPLLALALNLPRDWFSKPGHFDDPIASLRLLHYPAVKSSPEEGVFGAGAHSDYGILTLLALDHVSGLQICRNKDADPQVWEDVPSLEGTFVVNLGDCLERWTNHKFRSTLHRVINPGLERYSIPYFFEPNFDCLVECLPSCCSPSNPPRYEPVTVGDYLLGRYEETHEGFKKLKVTQVS